MNTGTWMVQAKIRKAAIPITKWSSKMLNTQVPTTGDLSVELGKGMCLWKCPECQIDKVWKRVCRYRK